MKLYKCLNCKNVFEQHTTKCNICGFNKFKVIENDKVQRNEIKNNMNLDEFWKKARMSEHIWGII